MEDLVIPDQECEKFIEILENHSMRFPKSISQAFPNNMKVSFLHLKFPENTSA